MKSPLDYPRLVLVALSLLTVAAILVAGATSTAAFGTYNPEWDGGASLRSHAEAVGAEPTIARNLSEVDTTRANQTLVVILAPESPYSAQDIATLSTVVERGGTVLVADDFGPHANDLLAGLGASARIDGRLLRDEKRYYRSPALPVATNVSDHPFTTNVSRLTLNHGTVIHPHGAPVLVSTSDFGYLDENRNGTLDDAEVLDSSPVATIERVGDGRVIVVSDPSLFINAMLDRPGNRAFVRTLFGEFEIVALDHSHVDRLPPVAYTLLTIRRSPLVQLLVGAVAIGLLGTLTRRPELIAAVRNRVARSAIDTRGESGRDGIEATLEQDHPDWDDERIDRVMRGINTDQTKENADDRSR